jgi:hypothetical protein
LRLRQALALRALCAGRGATFIVHDDIDLASAVDADGVHRAAAMRRLRWRARAFATRRSSARPAMSRWSWRKQPSPSEPITSRSAVFFLRAPSRTRSAQACRCYPRRRRGGRSRSSPSAASPRTTQGR